MEKVKALWGAFKFKKSLIAIILIIVAYAAQLITGEQALVYLKDALGGF